MKIFLLKKIKIIDKYIFQNLLYNTFICAVVIISMYIVLDSSQKFNDYVKMNVPDKFFFILNYYLNKLPFILIYTAPLISAIVVASTLIKMNKRNESLIVNITGISLSRKFLPIFAYTILVVALVFLLNELLLPYVSEKLNVSERIIERKDTEKNIQFKDGIGNSFFAVKLDVKAETMYDVICTKFNKNEEIVEKIYAKESKWNSSGWVMYDGQIHIYKNNKPSNEVFEIDQDGYLIESTYTPKNLLSKIERFKYSSISSILKEISIAPESKKLHYKLNEKLAYPFCVIVLTLMTVIPTVKTGPKNIGVGIGVCILATILFYSLYFVFRDFGEKGVLNPVICGWFPILFYGCISFYILGGYDEKK